MIETRFNKNKELEEGLRKEEKLEKRKKIGKKIFKIIAIILLILLLLFLYMHFIGAKGLVVKEYKVESNNLPQGFHGIKIVHFSDSHYLTTIKDKEVNEIVEKINDLKPEIIVFTGDLIDEDKQITDKNLEDLSNSLSKLKATIGIYAIKGHEDYNENYDKVISNTNFQVINNTYKLLYYKDNTPILLNGVGSILKNDCDIDSAFSYNEMDNLYTITLIHEPDVSDLIVDKYNSNLILAGYSHNGQIRLPFIGGILKLDEAKKYPNSKYVINDTKLFVSGGLGTTKYEFRLFNKPSINLYRLVKGTN